ncbi:cation diffusion facilitator family transporter [Thiorhodospira sibirica]|uniref:cation diffusion facilitator family transporter n=1 Tax=Thiorhodospira sibirica TaxID=154347 RepID=UPI00022C0B61|nr:cation diffusion facilitator family transporter [Thiorhodospira sibirica]
MKPHTATLEQNALEPRYREMRRVTLVGVATNLSLSATQIVGGVLSQSQALMADGLHTLSDLFSDMVVLLAARHANMEADENHPYGHGRIETLGTVIVGLALMGAGLGIGLDAGLRLFNPETLLAPAPIALFIACLGIVAKEGLYHYTMREAKRLNSNMLKANAWHHRSDVISSLVVLVGIGGTLAGLPYLDAVAAVFVAALIGVMGGRLIWGSVSELIDTALQPETVEQMRRHILAVEGVKGLHQLRTRRSGGSVFADVHLQIPARISVSEGHLIADRVLVTLRKAYPELSDITVHIDPEDDQRDTPCRSLPLRSELIRQLRTHWAQIPQSEKLENVILHYLGGRVHLELYLPLSCISEIAEAKALAQQLSEASKQVPEIDAVTVFFR